MVSTGWEIYVPCCERSYTECLLYAWLQASRIVAQLLVAGATTVLRAASQAWHKALQSE